MGVRVTPFGRDANFYELEAGGVRAAVTDFGAALVRFHHPDGTNVMLGYGDADGYRADGQSMGVVVGRYANRIAGGRLPLDGAVWTLPVNNGPNHLHGGPEGFGRRSWAGEADTAANAVRFTIASPHLDQGYPGAVTATAEYRLGGDGRLTLTLTATTDRPTVVNLAPHGHFNLAGGGDITGHLLRLNAVGYTPVDDTLIPTGEIAPVDGTAFDFRDARPFKPDIDHNFAVDGAPGTLRDVATVTEPVSGRRLRVRATAPGVQVYGGMFLGAGGNFANHAGFCLEPQFFPNSPNQPGFAVPRLDASAEYHQVVDYLLD